MINTNILKLPLVLQGRNIAESFPLEMNIIRKRRERKERFKIIVIDPRFTESVRMADMWLQIRPGTDGALLLSWIRTILYEGLYDREFVENWTNAHLLVRVDGEKPAILRECDVIKGGRRDRFVVWDTSRSGVAIWDPEAYQYKPSNTKPALEGSYTVALADGGNAVCKTCWQLLKERVEKCTPEWAESITWIPADKVVESARMYATHRPGVWYWGVSTDQIGRNGTRVQQMRVILRALTGNLNVYGGDLEANIGPRNPETGELFMRDALLQMDEVLNPEVKKKQLGADRFKLMTWPAFDITNPYYLKTYGIRRCMSSHFFLSPAPLAWRAILTGKPYPVKALITWAANPLVWAANTKLVYEALKSPNLELHVVLEHVMTPTAQLADYVLPIASKVFERVWCTTKQDVANVVYVRDKVIEPLGERRSDYYFWRELAVRLGLGEHFPWKTDEEVANMRLKPLGITVQELTDKGGVLYHFPPEKAHAQPHPTIGGRPRGFATPSGKVEIYSIVLEMLDYDPLPYYEEPAESPVSTPLVAKEYPLILTTGGRFRPMFHSEYRHYGMGTRAIHPDPIMEIHPDTARELGIAEGDWVWVETRRGRIKQKARVTPAIHPKVVNVQASWWFPERPGEEPHLYGIWDSLANVLTLDDPDTLDPLTGGWTNRALLCKVYKVQ
jgi:anaerobic selenocysteine-containing dehydrogenase